MMLGITRLEAIRRLMEEYRDLNQNLNTNIIANVGVPNEDDIFNWRVTLLGPKDTPYKDGLFFVSMNFPDEYPNSPPKLHFLTPIYHSNVNPKRNYPEPPGNVCLSILSTWNPNCKVEDILVSLYSLFYMTNPESPFAGQRENEYKNNRTLYEEKIKYFTNKYASLTNHDNVRDNNDWDFSYNP